MQLKQAVFCPAFRQKPTWIHRLRTLYETELQRDRRGKRRAGFHNRLMVGDVMKWIINTCQSTGCKHPYYCLNMQMETPNTRCKSNLPGFLFAGRAYGYLAVYLTGHVPDWMWCISRSLLAYCRYFCAITCLFLVESRVDFYELPFCQGPEDERIIFSRAKIGFGSVEQQVD